uniref:Putative secreted protein n=1 Tax=Anopheles triannulatus TaxID=58253 RepID=A0A2M4B349_9DIPT
MYVCMYIYFSIIAHIMMLINLPSSEGKCPPPIACCYLLYFLHSLLSAHLSPCTPFRTLIKCWIKCRLVSFLHSRMRYIEAS